MKWPSKRPPKPDPVVYLKRPRQVAASVTDGDVVEHPEFGLEITTVVDPPGSPAPATIVDALDELIAKLRRERKS